MRKLRLTVTVALEGRDSLVILESRDMLHNRHVSKRGEE